MPNSRALNAPLRETLRIIGGALFILGIWPIVFFVLSGGAINNDAKDLSVAGFLAVVGLIAQIGNMESPKAPLRDHSQHMQMLLKTLRWAVLGGILVIEIIVNFLRTT
jgi:hypothetical protein